MTIPYLPDETILSRDSYKNFHAKGLDYLCLLRHPLLTVKLYVLDGDASKVPEVVNPHNHRYDFMTKVLHGKLADYRWREVSKQQAELIQHEFPDTEIERFNRYDYYTPLNGGLGFVWNGLQLLIDMTPNFLEKKNVLRTSHNYIHTIRALEDQTVLLLHQEADVMGNSPTQTYSRGEINNDFDGLYERFTTGEYMDRLAQLVRMGIPVAQIQEAAHRGLEFRMEREAA